MVVATLASPGMPVELSELSLPAVPVALPVVGHPGSTGCWLDMLMDARTCADEAKTISAATPVIAILFIVRPRVSDAPTLQCRKFPRCDGHHKMWALIGFAPDVNGCGRSLCDGQHSRHSGNRLACCDGPHRQDHCSELKHRGAEPSRDREIAPAS
jgi:hypothetical protein